MILFGTTSTVIFLGLSKAVCLFSCYLKDVGKFYYIFFLCFKVSHTHASDVQPSPLEDRWLSFCTALRMGVCQSLDIE